VGLVLGGVLLALGAFSVLGWVMLGWIRRAYQDKILNDQSLTLDAIWLAFGTYYSVFRYYILQLAESHLTQSLFGQILGRIERLAWHPT
jgi:hypothetical protein